MLQACVLVCVFIFHQPILLPFVPYSDAALHNSQPHLPFFLFVFFSYLKLSFLSYAEYILLISHKCTVLSAFKSLMSEFTCVYKT